MYFKNTLNWYRVAQVLDELGFETIEKSLSVGWNYPMVHGIATWHTKLFINKIIEP